MIDLAKAIKARDRDCFVFTGGHSGSFIAEDCWGMAKARSIASCGRGRVGGANSTSGGVPRRRVAGAGRGDHERARAGAADARQPRAVRAGADLLRRRKRYFIGELDPCASIEFTRGCPWDCSFCSAWTFYGRTYRVDSPEAAGAELESIREPNVFIVDDVAFIHAEHGFAIGQESRSAASTSATTWKPGPTCCAESRGLCVWRKLGLRIMFLGMEAIDEEGLKAHRKRVSLGDNSEALEIARSIGVKVAINLIVDPDWDERRFDIVRDWAASIPEIVHLTVATPYPGTETLAYGAAQPDDLDYRLYDIQHAVLPTRLPLKRFYEKPVETQRVLNQSI